MAALLEHLDERFPEVDVLSAFSIFDPKTYAGMHQNQLKEFGSAQLKCIVMHVSGGQAEQWSLSTSQS